MQNVLNIEASKALAELGVEVESEKWWHFLPDTMKNCIVLPSKFFDNAVHALNLQELFSALPEIGKKLGWGEEEWVCHGSIECIKGKKELHNPCVFEEIEAGHIKHAHSLLDTYLSSGGDMEKVSAEIIRLIEGK